MSVLAKSAQALDVLEREGRPVRLTEIADELAMPKSSVHRIMSELADLRFVRRDDNGGFTLGSRMLSYGAAAAHSLDLAAAADDPMRELSSETGESVHLYVPEGAHRICIGGADGRYALRPAVRLGRPAPMGIGAAGQILLAFASPEVRAHASEQAAVSGRELPDDERLADIRREHWATSFGEREPGLVAGASSVLDPSGRVVGAVSVAGAGTRLTPARLEELRPLIHTCARTIQDRAWGARRG